MRFKDHFSERAALYSQFRPKYPASLFDWLAGLSQSHDLAWDCATGNGQAATAIASHFSRVLATDASERQIEMSQQHPGVEYRVGTADASGLPDGSVDLVTVAQAIHWLETDSFYREVKRVLARDGAIAVWCYGDPIFESEDLHRIVHAYNRVTVEDYWAPERNIILDELKTIAFPFQEVDAPSIAIECRWTLGELAGYLRTWSATARYAAKHGGDPVALVETELAEYWGRPEQRHVVRWPLHIRAGHV